MGVRKLQTYCETELPSTGFRREKMEDLVNEFQRDNPGARVEVLFDLECCLGHLDFFASTETRYGGEMAGMVELLRNFYDKFNRFGIKVIAFFGNYKGKDRRQAWITKRYKTVNRVMNMMSTVNNNYNADEAYKKGYDLSPSESVNTAAAIIRFELKETIVHSFTENDMEIMTYGRQNNSFAILTQDTDFIIAHAAQYVLSMRHLRLDDMSTCIYDSRGLADHLQLQLNQLPLLATMMGNDITEYELMKNFHRSISQFRNGKLNLDMFVRNIANVCRNVKCNEEGVPVRREDISYLADKIRSGNHPRDVNTYTLITDSIYSYRKYFVEKELRLDRVSQPELIALALTLYRQQWITCDLLMLICAKEYQMATCIEIFNERNIRTIGDILAKLRLILYGATFGATTRVTRGQSEFSVNVKVKEFVITGSRCLDDGGPSVYPLRVPCAQPLDSIWRQSLKPGLRPVDRTSRPMHPCVQVDEWLWEKIPESTAEMRNYMVTLFAQGCKLSNDLKEKLLTLIPGLPQSVLVPLFTFLYLDTEDGVYLSSAERDSVLFTFSLVAILTPSQVQVFQSHHLVRKADSVELIRISNLFMKATQLIINLNAVCGFPIPLHKVDGHNYWQGSIVQCFYQHLHENNLSLSSLFRIVCSSLNDLVKGPNLPMRSAGCKSPLESRFVHVIETWTRLGLCKLSSSRPPMK